MLELNSGDSNAEAIAKYSGRIATWGKGQLGPQHWKQAGDSLENLELVGVFMVSIT